MRLPYAAKWSCMFSFCVGLFACAIEPTVRDADLRIFDTNALGATYTVCASSVKWDGVNFTIEGLTGNVSAKNYSLGKLSAQQTQIREVNNMAIAIDAMFRQMCQSTIALRRQPEALAKYVVDRDKTALQLFQLLNSMDLINKTQSDPKKAADAQKEKFDATVAKLDPKR